MDFERGPWAAALNGDLDRLSKLLQNIKADTLDTSGYSSLHYASRAGHLKVVKYLVTHGADVNLPTRSNQSSPLHRASQQGHLAVVKFLLDRGADSGLRDIDGCTPLHRAALADRADVCQFLISRNPQLTQVSDALCRLPKDCCSSTALKKLLS
ncbi:hypothetical protein OUZ56_006704 [Daphnia magna]|nr:hypothetical protein OUZ56_006704 [Daphnia magna]